MSSKAAVILNLLVSVVFAIAMIVAAKWVEDPRTATTICMMFIAAWWIPFSVLLGRGRCC